MDCIRFRSFGTNIITSGQNKHLEVYKVRARNHIYYGLPHFCFVVGSENSLVNFEFQSTLSFYITKSRMPRGGCSIIIAGLHVDLLKQALMSVSGSPEKLFLIWLFFCIFLIFLAEVFPDFVIVAAPLFFITPRRALLWRYHQFFRRVQSPWNLAHSCWLRVDQRLPPAASSFSPQLDCLGCRLMPRLSHFRILLGLAFPFFDSPRQASEAPLTITQGERFLQVTVVPFLRLPIVHIAPSTPTSSVLSLVPASFCALK